MKTKLLLSAEVPEILKKSILVDGYDMVLDLAKSKGAHLYDAKSKKTYVDFFSFFASNPIGFNHPKMSEPDFEKKLLEVAKIKVSNSDVYTTAYAEFVSLFHEKIAHRFDRLFFIEGGALGVENAVKVAQDWKVRKNIAAGHIKTTATEPFQQKGTQVIHFKEAFHGRTGYTMSLTNTVPEKILHFPKFDWPRITNPKMVFPMTPKALEAVEASEKKAVQEIKQAFETRPNEICAILIETIQGEGGDNFFRKEFLKSLRDLCDTYDALLIFDEVQTGLGITGKTWAFEHFDVMPDLISFGKKVQVCGCAARLEKINQVDNVFKVPSRINSTWGGNLTDMVRSTRFIEIILEEKLFENAARLGAKMLKELEKISAKDERLSNVRGLGFWMAFDLPDKTARDQLIDICWNNGLIVLPCGTKSIRIRPVLDLKDAEAEEGLSIIEKSAKELK